VTVATLPHVIPFPLYGGTGVGTDVPYTWPVSLDGIMMPIDTGIDRWRHQSIELLRQQADQSDRPSESSLNPEGLWRRAQDSWHRGAGQVFQDRPGSDPFRFRSSKGIDIWTYYQFGLLPATQEKRNSANTNLYTAVAGSRLYITDGTAVLYSTNIMGASPTFTAVTATPGVAPNSICSDGFNVYVAVGASGIYKTDTSTGAAASYATGTVGGFVAYVKGRLLCSNNNSVYNVIAGGALPTPLLTHANTAFTWYGAAAGLRHIFLAGGAGDKSIIYRTEVKQDGTALDTPSVATELPDGEIIYSMEGYLGNYIFIGTNKGCRYATCDTDGNLTIGSLIPTPNAVRCFEPQDRYVWFGWTNYDGVSTGLGRIDLTQFTESIETGARVPAYASDLMATGQGTVQSIATFQSIRFFSVSGDGFYAQHATNLVSTGTIDTGLIGFGLPDQKTAMFIDVQTNPLVGQYDIYIAHDGSEMDAIGTISIENDTGRSFPVDEVMGERFEVRFLLTGTGTEGPVITRYTLKACACVTDGPAEFLFVPFLLHDTVDINGREEHLDVQAIRNHIKTLRQRGHSVIYEEARDSYAVIVEAYEWIPYEFTIGENGGFGTPNGTMMTKMKRVF
jgi:hypothetical protein